MDNENLEIIKEIIEQELKKFFEDLKNEYQDKKEEIEKIERKLYEFIANQKIEDENYFLKLFFEVKEIISQLNEIVDNLEERIADLNLRILLQIKNKIRFE